VPDERFRAGDAPKDLHAEWAADQAAARARDFGQADAATYEQRVREGAATVRHLEPEPPKPDASELARILDRIERSWPRRDAQGRGTGCARACEPER